MSSLLSGVSLPFQGPSPEAAHAEALPEVLPQVDVPLLSKLLDGEYVEVLAQVRALLATGEVTAPVGLSVEEHRSWVSEHLPLLGTVPGPFSAFPESLGGLNSPGVAIAAFEVLGHGDLSLWVKAGVHWGLFGGAIFHLGTVRHHETFLPKVVSLELPGCFAMTESGHGSDVHSIRTTATFDPASDEFVVHTPDLSARKEYIGNAARDGRMAVVFAQLYTQGELRGVHALLVPIRDASGAPMPGITIGDSGPKAGLNGVDNGRLSFSEVRVPRTSLLDRYGSVAPDGSYSSPIEDPSRRFFTMLGTLVQGRVSVAGAALSAAKSGLSIALSYAASRRQFGAPGTVEETVLLEYRSHQRRLLPLLAASYALHFAQEEVRSQLLAAPVGEEAADRRRLEARVAGHKALASWHTTRTLQECREACGGAGYLSANLLPRLKADTDVFTTFEGDNTVLSQLVAKSLLTEYKSTFGSLDLLGITRFVASRLADQVLERTSARSALERIRRSGAGGESGGVRDSAWHLEMFEYRESRLVASAARRIQAGSKAGRPAFEVFNDCQPHLLHAARAHTERLTFEAFVTALEACPDPGTRKVLDLLCDLYALSLLEADRGWFLEHDRMSPGRSKAVVRAVDRLCAEVAPHALDLTAAFQIPRAALPAPIMWDDPSRS